MRIHLIRHGQTSSNVSKALDTGFPGASLTELGREQAASLPGRLEGIPLDAIYTSPLIRTQQTATPLATARGLDLLVREGVREIRAGDMEMSSADADYGAYFETMGAWIGGNLAVRMGGLETGHDVLERFDSVVAEIESTGVESAAIVSHGAMITVWSAIRTLGLSNELVMRIHPLNTGICEIEGSLSQGFRAVSWMGERVG